MGKYIFNLKRNIDQTRVAMGDVNLAYKNALEWWRLEDIENGDPKWLEWVNGNPEKGIAPNKSLKSALANARKDYYARKVRLRARYGVNEDEIGNLYRMVIGYHPVEGMRSVGVGPYMVEESVFHAFSQEAHQLGVALEPQALLEWSDSIPYPERNNFPPDKAGNDMFLSEKGKTESKKKRILEVRSDLLNKFGIFPKTYNRFKPAEIKRGMEKYINKLAKEFGAMFDSTDLCAIIKSLPEDGAKVLDGRSDWTNTVYELDNNGEDINNLISPVTSPLNQGGSYIALNAKGTMKLFLKCAQDGNWEDLYTNGIQMVAQEIGKSFEDTKMMLDKDMNLSNTLLTKFHEMQRELKSKGDIRAGFISVATKRKPANPKVGAARPQTHRIPTAVWNNMALKMEIMEEYVANGGDLQLTSDGLNNPRKKKRTQAKGDWTTDTVKSWINAIIAEDNQGQRAKKKKQNRNPQEILDTLTKDFNITEANDELRDCGVDDMETAYKILSMSYASSEKEFLDRVHRVSLQMPEVHNFFAREGEDLTVSNKTLTGLRDNASTSGTPERERIKALKSEILQELGDADKKMEDAEGMLEGQEGQEGQEGMDFSITEMDQEKIDQQKPVQPVPTSTDLEDPTTPEVTDLTIPIDQQPSNTPEEAIPAVVDEPPQAPVKPKRRNFKDLMGNTLKGLIVLARDLDNKGKSVSAEEIHKVIRKYQGRI